MKIKLLFLNENFNKGWNLVGVFTNEKQLKKGCSNLIKKYTDRIACYHLCESGMLEGDNSNHDKERKLTHKEVLQKLLYFKQTRFVQYEFVIKEVESNTYNEDLMKWTEVSFGKFYTDSCYHQRLPHK